MASSWTMPAQRPDSLDRDANFFWHDMEGMPDDFHNDFLGEFVDFEAASQPFASGATAHSQAHALNLAMPTMPDPAFLDHHTESSSGFTTGDEFDLGSASSQVGVTMSAGSHEVDPQALVMEPLQLEYLRRESISDSDLPKLDDMTLYSPNKARAVSRPASPTADEKCGRSHKLVEALSSTIKKATTFRKGKKQVPHRGGSPTIPDVSAGRLPRQRKSGGAKAAGMRFPSPPGPMAVAGDPFIEPIHPPEARYFVNGYGRPLESPGVKSEPGVYANDATAAHMGSDNWPLPNAPNSAPAQWNDPTVDYLKGQAAGGGGGEAGWWNVDLQQQMQSQQQQHMGQVNKHAQMNMLMHTQHGEMPYEYAGMQDPSTGGLMIQMPQPRQGSTVIAANHNEYDQHQAQQQQHCHNGVGGIAVSGQTYLPPPPPIPSNQESPANSPDRTSHRPPRAKSSGARHLSASPVRKSRNGAASSSTSPGPHQLSSGAGHGQQTPRHSSSGSVGSTRSASGRLPASMPGTPCSVRKRRSSANLTGTSTSPTKANHSRRTSSAAIAGGGGGGNQRRPSLNNLRSTSASATPSASGVSLGGGGLGGGFVNFTPSDGGVLMTGVAPSGSSKTKARREKEAMERRRKLSEAAMKAVRDAGGDVEKLLEEGFAF